nr:MAG TPA: hypothetical protein [Caudoviricetes sp.]
MLVLGSRLFIDSRQEELMLQILLAKYLRLLLEPQCFRYHLNDETRRCRVFNVL